MSPAESRPVWVPSRAQLPCVGEVFFSKAFWPSACLSAPGFSCCSGRSLSPLPGNTGAVLCLTSWPGVDALEVSWVLMFIWMTPLGGPSLRGLNSAMTTHERCRSGTITADWVPGDGLEVSEQTRPGHAPTRRFRRASCIASCAAESPAMHPCTAAWGACPAPGRPELVASPICDRHGLVAACGALWIAVMLHCCQFIAAPRCQGAACADGACASVRCRPKNNRRCGVVANTKN